MVNFHQKITTMKPLPNNIDDDDNDVDDVDVDDDDDFCSLYILRS